MKKRILSIILTLCMILMLVPQTAFAEDNTSTAPSVSAYATKAQLMDSTFAPDSSGTAKNIGKLIFGKKTNGTTSQEWYILGKDNGVSGDNTIIFAASSIVDPKQNFWMNMLANWNVDKTDSKLWEDCIYNSGTTISKVYPNHYGSSDLRDKLQAIATTDTQYFTETEKDMMNDTTVTTDDTLNNVSYATTDKLYALKGTDQNIQTTPETKIYAGSRNQITLAMESYWNNENVCFWLRSPVVADVSYFNISKNCLVLNAYGGQGVLYSPAGFENSVQPAGNLKLSNVLFASAAEASSDGVVKGTIASGTAMTLRLNGSNKNIGTAFYNAATGDIKATKGSTIGDAALVVQGKNGTNDWYYSKKITGTETVNVSAIKSALGLLADIDLSACKIWLETTDTSERMIYAVEAAQTSTADISSVAITGIDTPTAKTALDTKAACATPGVSSTTPSVTWSPNHSPAGYNTSYTAGVTLTADTFYQFTGSTKATVNGQAANVTKNSDGTLTVTYTFSPTAKDKLISITAPAPKTVDNGTAYTAMNLPETVAIVTEGGTATSASVKWNTTDPANGSYDPAVLTEQKVTLTGTVTCPENIDADGVETLTTTIAITIKAADFVKAPQANPASGTYPSNQSVELSTQTDGAVIYYTTDGTTPSRTNGTKYTGAISVTGTEAQSVQTTIKAIAVKDKMQDSAVETFTYTIEIPDTTAPTGKIKIDEKIWETFLSKITFGLFFKNTQKVTITASDNSGNAVTIGYLLSHKALTLTDLAQATFTTYNDTFNIDPNNRYVIYARLTDASNNVKYINSEGIVLDSVVPVISGVENGRTYCSAQTFTVTEDYVDSVTVNGKEVTLDTNNQYTLKPAEGTQTIVVTDKAGNVSAEMIVTVNAEHTYEWRSENGQYWKKCRYCGEETAKQEIPTITIDGADRVCVTQDYKFSFTLPEGVTEASYGYEFENRGDEGLKPTIENGKMVAVIPADAYELNEDSFKIIVEAKTYDNFVFSVSKTVALQSKHNLEHVPAKAATVTETGNKEYWHCKDCDKYFSDEDGKNSIELKDTVISKLPPEIIEGKGQSTTAGEKKALSFTSNAAFRDFIRVELDGKTLDEKNYTVKEGSTIVTLKADYVGTLSVGRHTIGIVSESGTAAATFTVNAKVVVNNDTKPPQTGDNSMMLPWVVLLFVSGGLLTVTGIYGKKKKYNR